MGGSVSKALARIFGNKEMRILMLGLDAAGKTTILYKLKLNQSVTTIPTVGFNVETDVGGQDKIRPLWRHYYTGTQGLIFVVDSQDRDRIDEARQELHRIISDREMRECLLLVFANKQDLPGAMSPADVTEKLGLHRMRERSWYVHPSCATTGEEMAMKENVNKCTIYVGGLDDQVNEKVLHAAFIPFGDIVEIQIPPDPASHNQHRGFGFVEFEELDDAQASIDNMHLSELYGKVIKVNLARPMKIKEGSLRAVWSEDAWLQKYALKSTDPNVKEDEDEDDKDQGGNDSVSENQGSQNFPRNTLDRLNSPNDDDDGSMSG
ncbi:hypothetical protein G9A89_004115 [Geosiphon pyriformis]|nr:hypothetical protein G9A89_004115 [Geosiphon pyriformis]